VKLVQAEAALMHTLAISIPRPMTRAPCILEAITVLQLWLQGCEEGLFSGSYSGFSLFFAQGRSSEISVLALASQLISRSWFSKSEEVGCEGCPILSPASGDSLFT
jgi:hypothetical protein